MEEWLRGTANPVSDHTVDQTWAKWRTPDGARTTCRSNRAETGAQADPPVGPDNWGPGGTEPCVGKHSGERADQNQGQLKPDSRPRGGRQGSWENQDLCRHQNETWRRNFADAVLQSWRKEKSWCLESTKPRRALGNTRQWADADPRWNELAAGKSADGKSRAGMRKFKAVTKTGAARGKEK
jgi:hypothetical protein